jgi:hypothetical protein
MGNYPEPRYVVVHLLDDDGSARYSLVDMTSRRELKSYGSLLLAGSEANFLNDHESSRPVAKPAASLRQLAPLKHTIY